MCVLYVCAYVAILCLLFGESDQLPTISLETRFNSLETQLRSEALINSQRLSDLESLIETKLTPGKIAPVAGGVNVDVEDRLGDIERDINVFKDDVSQTIKRLARGFATEKAKVRKLTEELSEIQGDDVEAVRERLDTFLDQYNDDKASNSRGLNAQLLEAVGKLNDTFLEFSKDILSRKEVLVKEPPTPKPSCEPGWFQQENRCYLFVEDDELPWYLAAMDCQKRGGKLAEPQTPEINDELIDKVGNSRVWLGGTDEETEGVWVWSGTNEPIPYFTWGPKQPSSTGNQDCLEIWNKQWNDLQCGTPKSYLCEKSLD